MLVGSVKLPVDTPLLPILGSGSWASAVCTARRSSPTRHSRPLATTTAFGGYFAGTYLASFKNRQDAVVLTTHKGDVKHEQVSQLLASSGLPPVSAADYATAVHHSFMVVAAYALQPLPAFPEANDARKARTAYSMAARPGAVAGMQLVGFTRAISDGAFTAQITDLVVHPLWQSNAKGADGCIVFVKPSERMFFWRCGFRWSSKYRVMKPCELDP